MKLCDWLQRLSYELVQGNTDMFVDEVIYDSRKARENSVFVCIKGSVRDSHDFIPDVLEKGCKILVVEQDVNVPADVTVLKVENGRLALAELSAARFGYPAEKLTTIGITGTKGKTTTSYMIKTILEAAGKKTGLIGTNGAVIGEEKIPTANTTPESYVVQEFFAKMVEAGCECVVMEVSSQALMLHRVGGIQFDFGLFTNISPDHIGPNEHASFEEYVFYKSKMLQVCHVGVANINMDHDEDVVEHAACQLYTYGLEADADFRGDKIHYANEHDFVGVEFQVHGDLSGHVRVGMPGRFNADNALAALSVCSLALAKHTDHIETYDEKIQLKTSTRKKILSALEEIRVDGRMEIAHVSEICSVIIDYAHNAMSMESLLATLRDYQPKRLVCVFGCGGNRAKDRRYSMGEIGGKMADLCVITADNPRFEKNEDIIKDIEIGLAKTTGEYIVIPDRREAIFASIHNAKEGDMVAIIGKGHEDYQEIEGVRYHFKDREVVADAVKEMK